MFFVLVFTLLPVAQAVPLVRTQGRPRQPVKLGGHAPRVSLDVTRHAALSEVIPAVPAHVASSTSAEIRVFITANSGKKLGRQQNGGAFQGGILDPADSTVLWMDVSGIGGAGGPQEWILSGSDDGNGVFIKTVGDRYLVDTGYGNLSISQFHNGPWSLFHGGSGLVTLSSAAGNFLEEDAVKSPEVSLAGNVGDERTKFTLTLRDINWHVPALTNGTLLPHTTPNPEAGDFATAATQTDLQTGIVGASTGNSSDTTNKITVYINSRKNDGQLREKVSALDLDGDWTNTSQWTIVDSFDPDGRVYIASHDGAYLRDHEGTLDLDLLHEGDDNENKKWKMTYEGWHPTYKGVMSFQSSRSSFIEENQHDLQMSTVGSDNADPNPLATDPAFWALNVVDVKLFSQSVD